MFFKVLQALKDKKSRVATENFFDPSRWILEGLNAHYCVYQSKHFSKEQEDETTKFAIVEIDRSRGRSATRSYRA